MTVRRPPSFRESSIITVRRRHTLSIKKESAKAKKARFEKINAYLEQKYPDAACSLEYKNDPWKLLVMARLSAQCTDARVNIVSEELFGVFPDVYAFEKADIPDIEKIIYPCGLYHTKAKSIKEMSVRIVNGFGGKVPDTYEELMSLPGVGSKIANLMLGDVFGKGGIVADTHCIRISNRLGLAASKNQSAVERSLGEIVPNHLQSDFCHRLVMFGREVCTARNPDCENCGISELCPKIK